MIYIRFLYTPRVQRRTFSLHSMPPRYMSSAIINRCPCLLLSAQLWCIYIDWKNTNLMRSSMAITSTYHSYETQKHLSHFAHFVITSILVMYVIFIIDSIETNSSNCCEVISCHSWRCLIHVPICYNFETQSRKGWSIRQNQFNVQCDKRLPTWFLLVFSPFVR